LEKVKERRLEPHFQLSKGNNRNPASVGMMKESRCLPFN
jgi:hypothetical protein